MRRFAGWTVALLGAALVGPVMAESGIRVVSEDDRGVLLHCSAPLPVIVADAPGDDAEISVLDWSFTGEIGAPELPMRSVTLGLPEGTYPELQVVAKETRELGGVWPRPAPRTIIRDDDDGTPSQELVRVRDAAAYAVPFPAVWARAGEPGRMRHLRVVTIDLFPYRWDPAISGLRVATEMEVRVRFIRERGADVIARNPPAADDPSWGRVYEHSVANWGSARNYLHSPRQWDRALRMRGQAPEFRITVEKSELHRVTFAKLAEAGWDEPNLLLERLSLNERIYDEAAPDDPFLENPVPVVVHDVNRNGLFDAGDEFLFLGLTAWDRFHPPAHQRRYGRKNAYFLSARAEGGARMAEDASFLGRDDLIPETRSFWTEHVEGDGAYRKAYLRAPNDEGNRPLSQGVDRIHHDNFCWFGGGYGVYDRTFDLPGIVRPVGLRLAAQEFLGQSLAPPILVGTSTDALTEIPHEFQMTGKNSRRFDVPEAQLVGVTLGARGNVVRLQMGEGVGGMAIDWMEWTYERDFRPVADLVKWRTQATDSGAREFRLSPFSSEDPNGQYRLFAFETTDSLAPRILTYDPSTQISDGGRTLRVQFDLGAGGAARSFLVCRPQAGTAAVSIEREVSDDLAGQGDDQLIVIAPVDMVPGLERLAARRRAEGISTRIVAVESVFDQFNGGRAWPTAIRNYLRYLFRTRSADPTFLLLVGDGSDDFPGVIRGQNISNGQNPGSGDKATENLVPTQTLFSDAWSGPGPELAASDEWFVDNLSGTGETLDFRPDMHVGRLSVGDLTELGDVLDKLLAYGEMRPADAWRNRGLFLADDAYSNRIGFGGDYKYYPDELIFRNACRTAVRTIERAGFADFESDSLYLGAALDTIACLGRCEPINNGSGDCDDWRCEWEDNDLTHRRFGPLCYSTVACPEPYNDRNDNNEAGRVYLFRGLLETLNRGTLFLNYQGHANSRLMAHEYVMVEDSNAGRNDVLYLRNSGRPFLFMGFGCHLAEFSSHREGMFGRGDGLGEELLFLDQERGSIAVIASTAYEWLPLNGQLNLAIFHAWFDSPPQGPDGGTRWLLGEMLTGGKARLFTQSGFGESQRGMVSTYNLLGDPSMTIDLAPPRLDRVSVNGSPWIEGMELTSGTEGDSARIEIALRDEVMIQSVEITGQDGAVDPSQFALDPDPEHPNDDRRRILRYTSRLVPPASDFEIQVHSTDRAARERTATFPVRLTARLFGRTPSGWTPVSPSDYLAPGDSIRVEIRSPVTLDRSEIALVLDGSDFPLWGGAPMDGSGRSWQLKAVVPGSLTASGHALGVQVRRRSDQGWSERTLGFQGVADSIDLLELYNFPNPFAGETEFHFVLNGNARSAELSIFTLRGRRIRTLENLALRGDNVLTWDGLDEDGDPIANGVYFYKLKIETHDGRRLQRTERLARVQ